jgi:hypothetical protein
MGHKRPSGMASLLDARAASARHNVAFVSHGAWHDSDPLAWSAFHNGGSSKIAIFRHGNEVKIAIGMTIIFGTIVMFMCNSVPRLMSDL